MLEREECPKYSLDGWEKVEVCSESLKVTGSVDTEKRLVQAKGVSAQTPIGRALGPCGVVARGHRTRNPGQERVSSGRLWGQIQKTEA